ncbi:SDR family oxidoreductase [Pullulanibacillus sp. KACC 23026]|uniref:SDR family NAD(P)-dependent oxidoreductase n=1 Tax=Pullulanibacillus sp. KACC 23026 TaxID=3028315 RepID=UPI0023AF97D3|nr:SDR family oxidoreductase [Pullulanibacillus sp. KACC 23026]WEG14364.1 SDR family oxidoreductase [Pullulanibacillus sp. KACC 23026]
MKAQRLKGQTAVITGASSGIGRHMARECAADGANVILIARSTDKLERLKKEILMQFSVKVEVHTLDIGNFPAVKDCFETIKLDHPVIDILINNAGFGIFDWFAESKVEDIEEMFRVNVLGLMTVTRMLLPKMLQQGKGHIINIASIAGKLATPKSSVYSATKHAVLGFTNGLRMELAGTGVRVTAVNPGPIETNFFKVADKDGHYVSKVKRWMLDPELVAKRVVATIGTSKREINLPWSMGAGVKLYHLMPGFFERFIGPFINQK